MRKGQHDDKSSRLFIINADIIHMKPGQKTRDIEENIFEDSFEQQNNITTAFPPWEENIRGISGRVGGTFHYNLLLIIVVSLIST